MKISRNNLSKNTNNKIKNSKKREAIKYKNKLNHVCEKHHVFELTFRSCSLVNTYGKIITIDYDYIRGNMQASTLILCINEMRLTDDDYDLTELEKKKIEYDVKKKQEEIEKFRQELEKIKNESTLETPQLETIHEPPMSTEISQPENKVLETIHESPMSTEISQPENKVLETIHEPPMSPEISQPENKVPETIHEPFISPEIDKIEEEIHNNEKSKSDYKRDQALKQYKQQIANRNESKKNKFCRNILKDFKSKFSLIKRDNFKYFEVQKDSTKMVINDVVIYEIFMSINQKTYYLIIGDLLMKSKLYTQIDPAYQAEKVIKEQNDFMERIKNKEKNNF